MCGDSKQIMSIILIIIVLFLIGIPTAIGIGVWFVKFIWGLLTDGFVGSSSSQATGPPETLTVEAPPFIKNTIAAIKANPLGSDADFNTLKDSVKELSDLKCDSYESYIHPTHVKNTCLMAKMYYNAVNGILDTALTPVLGGPADKEEVRNITQYFLANQISYNMTTQDSYATMVKKFNAFEKNGIETLREVPSDYTYLEPENKKAVTTITSPRSYKCVSFNAEEQGLLTALKQRILGTPARVREIANSIEGRLCESKGFQSGKKSLKGCMGCMGCCEPTMDELPSKDTAAITGTGTVTADGTVAGAVVGGGADAQAKCPQPKLREYRLNRKPAKFRKVQAPTPAFMECFEDAAEDEDFEGSFGAPLGLRESVREQKAAKMFELAAKRPAF
jgi:hypothetical protein